MSGDVEMAHTNMDPSYPGYINITQTDSGVRITLRGDPVTRAEGAFVCGYSPQDTGQPGRCTPGDHNCNNYCNHDRTAPMPDRPKPCVQVFEGPMAQLLVSTEHWAAIKKQLR